MSGERGQSERWMATLRYIVLFGLLNTVICTLFGLSAYF